MAPRLLCCLREREMLRWLRLCKTKLVEDAEETLLGVSTVDNLALETSFREQGNVVEANVVYDRESGRSRGFGFVTYSCADEVNDAIKSLNGNDLDGRIIRAGVAGAPQRHQF